MKRKTYKKILSVSLAAAMVLSMAAPAVPVYAAAGDIHFNFNSLQPKLGSVANYTINKNPGTVLSGETYTLGGTTKKSLPFWKPDVTTNPSGFSFENTYNTYDKIWGTGNPSSHLNLDGYLLDGWYTDKANIPLGIKANQFVTNTHPYGENTYFAKLTADTSKKYELTERHHVVGSDGITQITSGVPGVFKDYDPVELYVLVTRQVNALSVPGYKLIDSGTGAPVVSSNGTDVDASHPLTADDNGNFVFSPTGKNVVGTMTNKPIDVLFRYQADPNMKFGVTVIHDKAGVWETDPVLREYPVNTDLRTVSNPIVPDSDLFDFTPGAVPKKYLTPTVVVEKPGSTLGNLLPLDTGDTLVPTGSVYSYDSQLKITGTMPNQPIQVRYIYPLNPAYTQSISVIYKNSEGMTITPDVVAKLQANGVNLASTFDTSSYGATASVPFYNTTDQSLEYKQNLSPATSADSKFKIYVPALSGYTHDIDASTDLTILSQAGFVPHDESNWGPSSHEWFDGDTGAAPNASVVYTVTYTRDQSTVAYTNFTASNGKLMVGSDEWDPVTHPSHQITLNKNVTSPGNPISRADIVIAPGKLPTPVGEDGYDFSHWRWNTPTHDTGQWDDLPAPAGDGSITLLNVDVNNTNAIINFEAVFVKNANWNTYHFASGDPRIDLTYVTTPQEVPNRDRNGAAINQTWGDTLIENNINRMSVPTLGANETVKWYDVNMQEMQTGSSMGDGMTYTAYIASNQPTTLYTPVISPVLDPNTGIAGIQLDTSTDPIQSGLLYAVVGADGNVVSYVPGTALLVNPLITTGINPGYTYTVHTVNPGTPLSAGLPIPGGASSPASNQITIPTTPVSTNPANPIPLVNPDPVNPGQVMITVRPTDDDTTYALRDPHGNLIRPYVSPTSGQVVFDNLDPNVIYEVLASKPGDTSSNLPTSGTLVDTTNVIPLRIPHKLSVILDPGFDLTQVKVSLDGGVTELAVNDPRLDAIEENTPVILTVPSLNPVNYNSLSGFGKNPAGLATTHPGGNTSILSFTMPYENVTIQPYYDPIGVVWNTNPTAFVSGDYILYTNDADANNTVVGRPNVTDPGVYRLVVNRDEQSIDTTNAVQADVTKPYTALFETSAWVEGYNNATSTWELYTGTVADFSLGIKTGALDPANFDYLLHEVATGSNAVAVRIENTSTDAMEDVGVYTGEISTTAKNAYVYAFGRIADSTFDVKINSTKNLNSFLRTIRVKEGLALSEPTYQSIIAAVEAAALADPAIDVYGVQWTYRGISSSATSYVPYNPADIVNSDRVLTLFFDSDKTDRQTAYTNLQDLIRTVENFIAANPNYGNMAALQAALTNAKTILHSTQDPTRSGQGSTTSELTGAFNTLRRLYPNSYPPPGGGGNSFGGGGGGGTKSIASKKNSLVVGVDGNWELIEPNEHKWVFNLTNGSRATGWNRLTYSYEGKTRTDWYYFNSDGIMRDGWFYDVQHANWYYLNENHDGFFGHMTLGWHHDGRDRKWYYLDSTSGIMRTGWNNLGGEWYFLNPTAPAPTYYYDDVQKKWLYNTSSTTRPLGSMYESEVTPDGYNVNASGAWAR